MEPSNGSLQKLKELTEGLKPLKEFVKGKGKGYVELIAGNGTAFGWNLLHEDNTISVDKWFGSRRGEIPEHQHSEKEWLIVYKGEAILYINEKKITLKPQDSYYIPPKTLHRGLFKKDTFFITITIPAGKGFPE